MEKKPEAFQMWKISMQENRRKPMVIQDNKPGREKANSMHRKENKQGSIKQNEKKKKIMKSMKS